jgi:hypothetical protein
VTLAETVPLTGRGFGMPLTPTVPLTGSGVFLIITVLMSSAAAERRLGMEHKTTAKTPKPKPTDIILLNCFMFVLLLRGLLENWEPWRGTIHDAYKGVKV